MSLRFEWDKNKDKSNLKKHKVRFDEAKTVFRDKLAKIFDDTKHSITEDREIIIAVNTDESALIFEYAHYDTTEDLFDIVPALTEKLKG